MVWLPRQDGIQAVVALVCVSMLACAETANFDPELTGMDPDVVSINEDTMATLSGRNLYKSIEVNLSGDSPASIDGDFVLEIDGNAMLASDFRVLDSQSMEVVIPAGLGLGDHSIELTIPDGRKASLAFTAADCLGAECTAVDGCGDGVCEGLETDQTCPEDCDWWDTAWTHRMRLGFDNLASLDDLEDFPVLVVLDATMIDYGVMQSGGEDLRFLTDDGTELAYEIESWNSNGSSYVWVKVLHIARQSDTEHIWMYYGNGSAGPGQNISEVWTKSYASVWHLQGPSVSQFPDSSGNGNTLQSTGAIGGGQFVPGQVSQSLYFDGQDDFLIGSPNTTLDITGDMTLMAWVLPETWTEIFPRIIHYHSATVRYVLGLVGEQSFSTEERAWWAGNDISDANTLTDSVPLGAWVHVTGVFDAATGSWRLYQDGIEVTYVDADDIGSDTEQLSIGVRYEDDGSTRFYMDGGLDEVRIIAATRSASWVYAQHTVMLDHFVVYGSEEVYSSP